MAETLKNKYTRAKRNGEELITHGSNVYTTDYVEYLIKNRETQRIKSKSKKSNRLKVQL